MASGLESFKNNLKNIVRPNRFLVYVNPPTILKSPSISSDGLKYYAQTATIPDRNFNEISVKYYGMELKIPSSEIIQDLNITFINDSSWQGRKLFEDWATLINDRSSNIKNDVYDLFSGAYIKVEQLGYDNNPIQTYIYHNVFLKTLDQIELNQETFDTIETYQTTFAYSYWSVK